MTRVFELSRHELEARRVEILSDLGMTYNDLAEKAQSYRLVADEWSAWAEIREIEFLLAADAE